MEEIVTEENTKFWKERALALAGENENLKRELQRINDSQHLYKTATEQLDAWSRKNDLLLRVTTWAKAEPTLEQLLHTVQEALRPR